MQCSVCKCWCKKWVSETFRFGDVSCRSRAAQRSVVENGVGDRWHYLHARVYHGIPLICLCHTVALVKQIKRSSLYVSAPGTRPFYLFSSALPYPDRTSSHTLDFFSASDSLAIPHLSNSVISRLLLPSTFFVPWLLWCRPIKLTHRKQNRFVDAVVYESWRLGIKYNDQYKIRYNGQ